MKKEKSKNENQDVFEQEPKSIKDAIVLKVKPFVEENYKKYYDPRLAYELNLRAIPNLLSPNIGSLIKEDVISELNRINQQLFTDYMNRGKEKSEDKSYINKLEEMLFMVVKKYPSIIPSFGNIDEIDCINQEIRRCANVYDDYIKATISDEYDGKTPLGIEALDRCAVRTNNGDYTISDEGMENVKSAIQVMYEHEIFYHDYYLRYKKLLDAILSIIKQAEHMPIETLSLNVIVKLFFDAAMKNPIQTADGFGYLYSQEDSPYESCLDEINIIDSEFFYKLLRVLYQRAPSRYGDLLERVLKVSKKMKPCDYTNPGSSSYQAPVCFQPPAPPYQTPDYQSYELK